MSTSTFAQGDDDADVLALDARIAEAMRRCGDGGITRPLATA